MPQGLRLFSLLAVASLGVVPGFAGDISNYVVPPGVNYGEQYRLIFVTSVTNGANSMDIGYYDSFVTQLANAPGSMVQSLNLQWKVVGTTADYWTVTTNAIDHIATTPDVPIYGLDGIQIATGVGTGGQGLFSGSLMSGIHITEQASDAAGARVYTGICSASTGLACTDGWYALGFFQDYTMYGYAGHTDGTWATATAIWRNSTSYSLYAISPALTNDAPEPAALGFIGGGMAVLCLVKRLRRPGSYSA